MSDQDQDQGVLDRAAVPGQPNQAHEIYDVDAVGDDVGGARLQMRFMLRCLEHASPEEQVWITEEDWQAAEAASAWLDASTEAEMPPPTVYEALQDAYVHLYPDGQPIPEEQMVAVFAAMSLEALCPSCGAYKVYELGDRCGHCAADATQMERVTFLGNRPVGGTDSDRRTRVIHRCGACAQERTSPPGPCALVSVCKRTDAHAHVAHRRWPLVFRQVCGGSRGAAPGAAERGCGWSA